MREDLEHCKCCDADGGTADHGECDDLFHTIIFYGTIVETCDWLHALGYSDTEREEDKTDLVDDACTCKRNGFSIDGLGTIIAQ